MEKYKNDGNYEDEEENANVVKSQEAEKKMLIEGRVSRCS
jgi:hypothetical protein